MKMRTSDLECIGDRLHREASFGCDKSRKLGFFDSDFARASRKILDFHRFAAEHPLKLTDALFEPADLRAPDNWFIRSHRCSSALGHQPAPTIQQVGSNAAPSRNRRHGLTGWEALLDDLQLLLARAMPPATRPGDQFDTLLVVRHKPVLEDSLKH